MKAHRFEDVPAAVLERDTTRPTDHAAMLRSLPCGEAGCQARAPRWARCRGCRALVARCDAHAHRFVETVRSHC